MTSLGAISLGSFQTAAILLAGLFCYDIFWVFGTDVMMTVATKIEAPVKFIYTAPPPIEGAEPREYPFSVLGLGDVVIPGLFVRFMTKLDAGLQPAKFSYFGAATFAYAFGEEPYSVCIHYFLLLSEISHLILFVFVTIPFPTRFIGLFCNQRNYPRRSTCSALLGSGLYWICSRSRRCQWAAPRCMEL